MRPAGNQTGARMNSLAIDLRNDGDVASRQPCPAASGEPAGPPAPLSSMLMGYWREQLARPVVARRQAFAAARARVRLGADPVGSLLPFALGDTDEDIVFRATTAYLCDLRGSESRPDEAAEDAIEWVRRRLALNRAAVIAALLSTGDERVLERLLPLRLTTDDAEIEVVRRRLGANSPAPAREFVRAWLELRARPAAQS
jgi:hypothetical protein